MSLNILNETMFTLDYVNCTFLGMIDADVEGGGNFPGNDS